MQTIVGKDKAFWCFIDDIDKHAPTEKWMKREKSNLERWGAFNGGQSRVDRRHLLRP